MLERGGQFKENHHVKVRADMILAYMRIVVLILRLSLLSGGLKVKLGGEVEQRERETVRMSKQM